MTKNSTKRLKKPELTSSDSVDAQFDALKQARDEEQGRDPFLWLDRLVGLRIHRPAELATAIERFGVYGFDRYGRYGFRKAKSAEADRALDALAMANAAYQRAGTYQCDEIDALPLSSFGWPSSVCPDFKGIKDGESPEPPRDGAAARLENSSLSVIGALLLALKGEIGDGQLDGKDTEQTIIDVIVDEVIGSGLSKRNLQTKFAAAKRMVTIKPKH